MLYVARYVYIYFIESIFNFHNFFKFDKNSGVSTDKKFFAKSSVHNLESVCSIKQKTMQMKLQ